jgi:hypothetical protein
MEVRVRKALAPKKTAPEPRVWSHRGRDFKKQEKKNTLTFKRGMKLRPGLLECPAPI